VVLPKIPIHTSITPSTQAAVTATMAAFAAGALIYSLYHWRRSGKPVFLALFVAGGCMMAMEAFVDTVGGCWFPRGHSWVVFTAFGRPIPVWLCLAYFFYFGILGGLFWTVMRRGVTGRVVWGLFLIGVAGDAIFEMILLHFHTYIYYGGQPLRVLRFPFWWGAVNSLIVVVVSGAVARLETYLTGRRAVLIIPIAVSGSAAVNAVAGWPSWLVINSKMPAFPRQLGGVLTYVIAAWIVSLVVRVLPRPGQVVAAAGLEPRVTTPPPTPIPIAS
jgi:hypothetical protein